MYQYTYISFVSYEPIYFNHKNISYTATALFNMFNMHLLSFDLGVTQYFYFECIMTICHIFFTQYKTFLCINFQICTYFLFIASSTLILLNYTLFLFSFQTVIKISSINLATCVCISQTTTVKEEKIQQNTG